MTKLSLAGRPWVSFEADNEQHRQWYAEFVKHGSWGHVPVRFLCGEEAGNVYTIERKLLEFYVKQEFNVVPSEKSFPKTFA